MTPLHWIQKRCRDRDRREEPAGRPKKILHHWIGFRRDVEIPIEERNQLADERRFDSTALDLKELWR